MEIVNNSSNPERWLNCLTVAKICKMSSQSYIPFLTMHDKIHHRSGHITFLYKEYMLVWGGYMENAEERSRSRVTCVYHNTNELWAYDINTEIWSLIMTKGDTPPRNSGACGVLYDDFLYVFGGYHGVSDNFVVEGNSNQLLRLDLTTMTWKQLLPKGVSPTPCDKLVGWEYQGKLYFFGGFGPAPDIWSSGTFDFVPDHSLIESHPQRGWNNQLVSIDVRNCRELLSKGREKELLWEWPKTSGALPSPRAAHAADICGSRLYLFGGRLKNNRMNDLHCLDMETMHWSGDLNRCHQANPEGRSWHSLTFVEDGKAVLYGGFNQHNVILKDCWVLEVPSMNWVKLCDGRPRLWHRASFLNTGDLIIMGGHKHSITDPRKDHAEDLFVLNFTPKSLLRLCLDEILKHQKQLSQNWCWLPETLQAMLRLRVEQCFLR